MSLAQPTKKLTGFHPFQSIRAKFSAANSKNLCPTPPSPKPPESTFSGALGQAVNRAGPNYKKLFFDLKTTLKNHPVWFLGSLGAYFGVSYGITGFFAEMDKGLSKWLTAQFPQYLDWAKLTVGGIIVGGLKSFIADYASQTATNIGEGWVNTKRLGRAATVALFTGCLASGIFTANWLSLNATIGSELGLSLPEKIILLYAVVQTIVTLPYFLVFNVAENSAKRLIYGQNSPQEIEKRRNEFWPNFWKPYVAAAPANVVIALAVPLAPPEISLVIVMTVSFGVFLIRALSTLNQPKVTSPQTPSAAPPNQASSS